MSKPDLPSITEELAPRRKIDLKALRSAPVDDREITENSRKLGAEWGAQTSLDSKTEASPKSYLAAPIPDIRGQVASLRIEVPEYLDRELAFKAVEMRCTKQHLVVKALRDAGFRVDDVDLVEDRRKARRNSRSS